MEALTRRWWAGELGALGGVLSVASAPLSWAWAGVTGLGALRVARTGGAPVEGLTVVSVGNLAVGGTGKTPFAAWLARAIGQTGVPTWVITGGRGEDEARLHRAWNAEIPVIADRDRVAAARRARNEGARVAVLDDGFQHRRLARDLDVVLLSLEDPFPGRLLPRGPYREGPRALARAGVVLLTRRRASPEAGRAVAARLEAWAPQAVKASVHLAAGHWTRLDGESGEPPAGDVVAACGVARPALFRTIVAERLTGSVELVTFADHHPYAREDALALRRGAGSRPIVTTPKDALKLRAFADDLGEAYVLGEDLTFDWGEDDLRAALGKLIAGVGGT